MVITLKKKQNNGKSVTQTEKCPSKSLRLPLIKYFIWEAKFDWDFIALLFISRE